MLAQLDIDPADNRFPLAVYRPFSGHNVHVSIRFIGHPLGVAARDERFTVFFDGRELFVAIDRRFPGPPGKVGLGTKADDSTRLESLKIGLLE